MFPQHVALLLSTMFCFLFGFLFYLFGSCGWLVGLSFVVFVIAVTFHAHIVFIALVVVFVISGGGVVGSIGDVVVYLLSPLPSNDLWF